MSEVKPCCHKECPAGYWDADEVNNCGAFPMDVLHLCKHYKPEESKLEYPKFGETWRSKNKPRVTVTPVCISTEAVGRVYYYTGVCMDNEALPEWHKRFEKVEE